MKIRFVNILLFTALNFILTSGITKEDVGFDAKTCTFNGLPLYGKVQFVTSFADVKIKFVESFPDIKVKFVTSFADDCGEWQITNSFPDIKVQVVESFPDIKVKVVDAFPGCK